MIVDEHKKLHETQSNHRKAQEVAAKPKNAGKPRRLQEAPEEKPKLQGPPMMPLENFQNMHFS